MTTDRELLEWAAKAAGIDLRWFFEPIEDVGHAAGWLASIVRSNQVWNPLVDDGDALRLAVKLGLTINPYKQGVFVSRYEDEEVIAEPFDAPGCNGEATRRAIVRAAASIGQSQENQK